MKTLKLAMLFLCFAVVLYSCKKENSNITDEPGPRGDTTWIATLSGGTFALEGNSEYIYMDSTQQYDTISSALSDTFSICFTDSFKTCIKNNTAFSKFHVDSITVGYIHFVGPFQSNESLTFKRNVSDSMWYHINTMTHTSSTNGRMDGYKIQ